MSSASLARPTSPSHDFSDSAISRAKAVSPAQGLFVSRVLVTGGVGGDLRAFVKQAETAKRLGCQAILQIGEFGFQSHLLHGEAYLDQAEKYAQRFGVAVVWTPGDGDNLGLLARIPAGPGGLVTLRSRIRCAPDHSSWTWGDTTFGTLNSVSIPGQRVGSKSALSTVDVLVVRGDPGAHDALISPKLRLAVYGSSAARLVSGASPRTGKTVGWTEQAVLDLHSVALSTPERANQRPPARQTDDFEAGVGYLRLHALENQDTFMARSHVTDDGFHLGRWTAMLRSSFQAGRLDAKKISAVEGIPYWQWDPYEPITVTDTAATGAARAESTEGLLPVSSLSLPAEVTAEERAPAYRPSPARPARPLPFETWFGQLEKFVAEHGHARPPKNYLDLDGFRIGRWVGRLRSGDRRSRLSAAETAALEALPGWSWATKKDMPPPVAARNDLSGLVNALGGPVGLIRF